MSSFSAFLFSKPGDGSETDSQRSRLYGRAGNVFVQVHQGCEIPQRQCSSRVSDSRDGYRGEEQHGPLALGPEDEAFLPMHVNPRAIRLVIVTDVTALVVITIVSDITTVVVITIVVSVTAIAVITGMAPIIIRIL